MWSDTCSRIRRDEPRREILQSGFLPDFSQQRPLEDLPFQDQLLKTRPHLRNAPRSRGNFDALKRFGLSIALDDFGTGYSSFSYLSRLVFDRLKIDRAVIHAGVQAPERSAVSAAIIAMAHGLGLQVVAEGIETAAQQALLAAQGCDVVQGFHIGRPMPLDDLLVWQPPAPA